MGIEVTRNTSAREHKIFTFLCYKTAVGNIIWFSAEASLAVEGIVGLKLMYVNAEFNKADAVIKSFSLKNIIVGKSVLAVNSAALAYSYMRVSEGDVKESISPSPP